MIFPISRFNFNLNFPNLLISSFKTFFLNNKNEVDKEFKKEMKKFYPNSELYSFSYGRSSYYYLLKSLRKQTSKNKIMINSFTLFEMINMIIYAGFEPILMDLNDKSFQSNFENAIKKYNKDLAAITITHLNGINSDIYNVKKIIKEDYPNIILIEDNAVNFGSMEKNKFSGNIGDYTILSFNFMKNITSMTGGVLIENSKKVNLEVSNFYFKNETITNLFKKILFFCLLKFLNSRMIFFFFFKFIKFSKKFKINFFLKKYRTDFNLSIEPKIPKNYLVRMHSFQKILLINQFKNFKNQHLSRIEKSNYYFKNLKHIKEITFPQDDFSTKNLFIDFPIIVDEKQKKIDLCNYFLSKNVDIKDYYYSNCGSNQLYKKYIFNNIINSNKFANNIIMLPVSEKITKKYQDYIIRNMIYFFKNN